MHPLKGKLILLGEHSVVYGAPAVAIPAGPEVTWHHRPLNRPGALFIEGIEEQQRVTLESLLHSLIPHTGFALTISGGPPRAAGMGASAVLSVILVDVACQYATAAPARPPRELVRSLEGHFHGTPSGIDDTVVWFGAPVLFQRPRIQTALPFPHTLEEPHIALIDTPPLSLVVGHSGGKSETSAMVAMVKARLGDGVTRFAGEMTLHFEEFLRAWGGLEYQAMGRVMRLVQAEYKALGIATPAISAMVSLAIEEGAYGAKLSGAGGGGVVFAIGESEALRRVDSAWRRAGFRIICPAT